ncbi:M23 family metallopeptidase [Chitinophaga sp. Mgbs1]|uniref:M23 family metallopeptidase n=1 Tax=Chitinophaga solisilvae TaxID=1233460 RepID=A0A3S1CTI4_9BACT|nr:M23 family metallopeptidase [Chitinophaga solisilvae]
MQHLLSTLLLLSFLSARAQTTALSLRVPHPPQAQTINNTPSISYELQFINYAPSPVLLTDIQLRDAATSRLLLQLDKTTIPQWIYSADKHSDSGRMMPGSTAILYLEAAGQLPDTIIHHIAGTTGSKAFSISGAKTALVKRAPVVLGPPLGAGIWAAIYHPSWARGHRRVIFVKEGTPRIPGRYAIDFIQLDNNGKYTDGRKEDSIRSWIGYGAEVLAVADGEVAAVRNDFAESATLSAHPAYGADDATGNYISLKIADNTYVFYEHLQPGSIRVKPGQRIRKGAVIASLGFTGQSTGPHLHLHVADSNSPLGAEGIPYVFDTFTIKGVYPDLSILGKSLWQSVTEKTIKNEHPSPNSVIRFFVK